MGRMFGISYRSRSKITVINLDLEFLEFLLRNTFAIERCNLVLCYTVFHFIEEQVKDHTNY